MKGLLWLVLVVALVCISFFLHPLNAMDTGWDFGHAYTLVNGGYGAYFNPYTHASPAYLYGVVITPLAYISTSPYIAKIFYSLLLALLALLLYIRKNEMGLSIGLILLLLSNYSIITHRPEIFTIVIGLVAYPYLFNNNTINWKIAIPVGLCLFLIHPANAILMGAALLASKLLLLQVNKTYLLLYLAITIATVSLLIFGTELHHVFVLKQRILTSPLNDISKFIKYSGFTLLAFVVASRKDWSPLFIINYGILILLCLLLGPYYYYIFLIVPLLLLKKDIKDKLTKTAVLVALCFNLFTSIVHPYFVNFENIQYAKTAREVISIIEKEDISGSSNKVFVEQHIALPLYAKSSKIRMLLNVADDNYFIVDKTEPGDIAYFTSKKDAALFSSQVLATDNQKTTPPRELVKQTKGKLTLQSLYTARTDSVGLYKVTIL